MRRFLIIFSVIFYSNLFAQELIDTDGDGITDIEDHCPTVKGPKENNGCQWQEMICYSTPTIYFEKDKTNINESELKQLDNYISSFLNSLKKEELEQLSIISYTSLDSDKNKLKKLAKKRAENVKKIMIKKNKIFRKVTIELKIDSDLRWKECADEECPEWKINEENRISFGIKKRNQTN
ncbi:OmpA family protein [Empedobacter sedimenti]|uniref:OmpA family protein n=1 Tax=Empedobacter sedimenti TaxID=3042610 RepID=UPI0024A61008|nr:OmpA family protein [Empedobacter sedimenti]